MILYAIIACEIGFWLFLGAGLISRYLLDSWKLGAALLVCALLVNLVLLVAAILDLRAGAEADFTHGLGAVYLGFTVVFGHSMVRWADVRFARRFAGGPPPEPKPKHGKAKIIYEWREFGKGLLAWAISCALLAGAILLVNEPASTEVFMAWISRLTLVLAVWFVFWPLGHTIFPPNPKTGLEGR